MTGERRSLLEELAPTFDASSRHAIRIAASPARVYAAARRADVGKPTLVRLLMGLRALPAWLARRRRGVREQAGPPPAHRVGPLPFTLIAETPGEEFVLGILGRFWTPTGGVVPADADAFRQPPPPGLAQGLWNFRVTPVGAETELSTETRVRCGDADTRRNFLRYWRLIRPGSGLIRRSMLREIRRRTLSEIR